LSAHANWWHPLFQVLDILDNASIDYTILEEAALFIQGVPLSPPAHITISIQWDLFTRVYKLFQPLHPSRQIEQTLEAHFTVTCQQVLFELRCSYNTVVMTDPDRLSVPVQQRSLPVRALDYYLQAYSPDDPRQQAIKTHLRQLQRTNNQHNASAWNQDTYNAWLHRHGTPQEAAQRLLQSPLRRLGTLRRYLDQLVGKKVINLLGSHGGRAIAMALLGADVTVVDIAPENALYAQEVAQAASIPLRYLVSDVLQLPESERDRSYDIVLMEMGILHYFIDLAPLVTLVAQLLRPQGQLILQDFHPVSTKLITSRGKKHRVDGNYFDKTLITTDVAFSKHLQEEASDTPTVVYQRRWTLGEIVTAFAAELTIRRLDEEPNSKLDDIGLPKIFTLIAEKGVSV